MIEMLDGIVIIVLFEGGQSGSTIILRASPSLLIAEVLACIGGEEPDVFGILATPLHLGLVIGFRKRLFLPSKLRHWAIGGKEQLGPVMGRLQHDRTVAELLNEAILALDSGIRNLGDLVAFEAVPLKG
jgi:hypothetical protein